MFKFMVIGIVAIGSVMGIGFWKFFYTTETPRLITAAPPIEKKVEVDPHKVQDKDDQFEHEEQDEEEGEEENDEDDDDEDEKEVDEEVVQEIKIKYILKYKDSFSDDIKEVVFVDGNELLLKLDEGNNIRTPNLSLIVEFDKEIISEYHDADFFKRWLNYLGVAVFAQRVLTFGDFIKAAKNVDFLPNQLRAIDKVGCVRFLENEEKWKVKIFSEEKMSDFARILVRGLKNPETMANIKELERVELDKIYSDSFAYSQNQKRLAGYLFNCCLPDVDDSAFIDAFFAALPLLDFKICDEVFQQCHKCFFEDFYEQIVVAIIGNRQLTQSEADFVYNQGWELLEGLLRSFIYRSKIKEAILESLFNS